MPPDFNCAPPPILIPTPAYVRENYPTVDALISDVKKVFGFIYFGYSKILYTVFFYFSSSSRLHRVSDRRSLEFSDRRNRSPPSSGAGVNTLGDLATAAQYYTENLERI